MLALHPATRLFLWETMRHSALCERIRHILEEEARNVLVEASDQVFKTPGQPSRVYCSVWVQIQLLAFCSCYGMQTLEWSLDTFETSARPLMEV